MARGSGGDRHHAGREFGFTDLILSKFQPSLLERKKATTSGGPSPAELSIRLI
jgi:hypothetical protein